MSRRKSNARRHRLVANVKPNGEPDGTYRCLTCLAEQAA